MPFARTGSRRCRREAFDFRTDATLPIVEEVATNDAMLLLDGSFLLRRELEALWNYCILVDVPVAIALQRTVERDLALFGSAEAVTARYQEHYIPGQQLYFAQAQLQQRTGAIVVNEPVNDPSLTFPRE